MDERRFAKNIKWQFVANAGQALLGGAYLLLLGRLLGPHEFGVLSSIMALATVAGLLFEMRLQDVVAKNLSMIEDGPLPSKSPSGFLINLLILETASRVLPVVGLIALAPALAPAIQLPPDRSAIIAVAAIGFLLGKTGNGVSTGLLRVFGRTDVIALCVTIDWFLRLFLILVLALSTELSVTSALWISLASGALCNVLQGSMALRIFIAKVGTFDLATWSAATFWRELRKEWRLVSANLGVSASDLMAKDLDIAIISSLLPAEKVGLYKMAKSMVQMMWRAIDPFYLALMPEVQRLWLSGEHAQLRTMLIKMSRRLMIFAFILAFAGSSLVWAFADLLLGPGYQPLASLVLLMSGWVVLCAPLVWGHPLAVAIDRPELAVVGSLIGSAIGFSMLVILTPHIGLTGAAVAWAATLISSVGFTAAAAAWFAARKQTLYR